MFIPILGEMIYFSDGLVQPPTSFREVKYWDKLPYQLVQEFIHQQYSILVSGRVYGDN